MKSEYVDQPEKQWETPTLVCTGTVGEILRDEGGPCTQGQCGDD